MSCNYWKCEHEIENECECIETECIGDLCEEYQECESCMKQDSENCPKY